ncbi:MAG: DUF4962 domain-containing protein, partial [Draconibacterium sp.]|nr:DUF4962 domain-containing protein [Draconibacterium sp.]
MKNILECKSLKMLIPFFIALVLVCAEFRNVAAQELDRAPESGEINYYPEDGEIVASNPPPFMWLPVDGAQSYFIQYSSSSDFEPENTAEVSGLKITVHTPTEVMQPGSWFWRYGYIDKGQKKVSKTRSFKIPAKAVVFPFVPVEKVLSKIPKEHPRLHFSPELVKKIRNDKKGRFDHITKEEISKADEILKMNEPLFQEPKMWDEYDDYRPVYNKAWRSMRPYTQRMVTCALAYLYTGEQRYANEAKRRLMHFMTWD